MPEDAAGPLGALAAPRHAPLLAVTEQALFALANLGAQILLARAVAPEAFGAYTVASTFLLIAAIAHQTCVVEPMVVLSAGRLHDALGRYHARLLREWSLALSLGVVAAGGLAAGLAALLDAPAIARALAAFALVTPVILYLWLARRIAFVLGRLDLSVAATAIYAGATLLVCGAAALAGRLGPTEAIAATGLAAAAAVVFLRARLRWPAGGAAPGHGLARRHLAYGRWALGAEAVAWGLTNGPILAAPVWFGLAAAGELRALSLAYMPLLQVASVASLLMLRRFAGDGAIGGGVQRRAVLALGGGAALYVVVAVAAGPMLLPRILGADYALGAPLLAMAGLGAICLVTSQVFITALRARAWTGGVLIANLAALALLSGLAPALATRDLPGLIAAQTLASAALLAVAAALARPGVHAFATNSVVDTRGQPGGEIS